MRKYWRWLGLQAPIGPRHSSLYDCGQHQIGKDSQAFQTTASLHEAGRKKRERQIPLRIDPECGRAGAHAAEPVGRVHPPEGSRWASFTPTEEANPDITGRGQP